MLQLSTKQNNALYEKHVQTANTSHLKYTSLDKVEGLDNVTLANDKFEALQASAFIDSARSVTPNSGITGNKKKKQKKLKRESS